jgi:hypothetical protein
MREHLNTPENRQLLEEAILAKCEYWDKMRELEQALGLDDVPDTINNFMHELVEMYAVNDGGTTDDVSVLQSILDCEGWEI